MRALYTAASGMQAQETHVQVVSNNIANMRTSGFKRQRVQFQDLLYQTNRRAGAPTSDQNTQAPAGVQIGSGVKVVSTPRIMTQGNVSQTEKSYDVAVRGEGYFRVLRPDGVTAYTRDGSFDLDAEGRLVTSEGYLMDPPITVPNTATSVNVSQAGAVTATLPGQTAPQALGQVQLARFVNKVGLDSVGDNLFLETAGSGPALTGNPGTDGFGTLQQGYLEESNVNAVTEISTLISAQRAYELNSKVITAADQMLSATSSMFRG